jgi:hypothetical protein
MKRIKNVQTGNPGIIVEESVFKSKFGRKVETALHNLYSYKRTHGEWFKLTLNDVLNFKRTCEILEKSFESLNKSFLN